MPEQVLLSMHIAQFHVLLKRRDPEDFIGGVDSLWNSYCDHVVACFLCGGAVLYPPPRTEFTAEPDNLQSVLAAPLCADCAELSDEVRWDRTRAVLEKLYSEPRAKRQLIVPYRGTFPKPLKRRRVVLAE